MKYCITGHFVPDGYSIWEYLPDGASQMTFPTYNDAVTWAKTHSKGPNTDGVEPVWMAEEVAE